MVCKWAMLTGKKMVDRLWRSWLDILRSMASKLLGNYGKLKIKSSPQSLLF